MPWLPGYTGKLVCQTTPQTNILCPFLPLGPAHLLLQTVCGEFVLEPAGSPGQIVWPLSPASWRL